MLILKVTSENVSKVHKLYCNYGGYNNFSDVPKTPFRWMNPKVIGSYTFNIFRYDPNLFKWNKHKIGKNIFYRVVYYSDVCCAIVVCGGIDWHTIVGHVTVM